MIAPFPLQQVSAYVHPGFLFATAEPTLVTVILGSCVSVCLYDSRRRVGGANHFLLPHCDGGERNSGRYGIWAVPALLDEMALLGCTKRDLTARVFGGASITEAFLKKPLGARNVDLALALLDHDGIAVETIDTLGTRGRKVTFRIETGETEVRYL